MNSIVTGLLEAGHEVKILAVNSPKYNVSPDDIPEDYKQKTGIELIDVDLRVKPFQAFKNLFSSKSYHVERFISKEFTNRLIEVLKADIYDVVQLETLFMTPYVETIRKYTKASIVLRAHNVEHLIWERIAKGTRFFLKRAYIRHLAKTLKNYEMNAISQVDGIAAITRKDAAFFRKYCATTTVDIPFGVNPEEFTPNYEIDGKPRFYHIGSMNWMPNEEGIRWFIDDCMEAVVEKTPDFVIHLAGRHMPEWLHELKDPHVDVVGEVPNAKEFVASHDVAIVPLLSGSGIRIKIIESMAMGKTVITTQIGAEGILYDEDVNVIIAENKAKMAEAIRRINENPASAVDENSSKKSMITANSSNAC